MITKGIILAGGLGTRLRPSTISVSKQLLPVYNKPMLYYPLTTLMLAGIRSVLVICLPRDLKAMSNLLGDGSQWGMDIKFAVQPEPNGIAESFIIGKTFIENNSVALILGDNIFYGSNLTEQLRYASTQKEGAYLFVHKVSQLSKYGVVEFDNSGTITSIEEKPSTPKGEHAVTGLYFYDSDAYELSSRLKKSSRGELEITDLNNLYLKRGRLNALELGRGYTWFDAGTHENLLAASNFVAMVQERQGVQIGCPEEVAFREKWIDHDQLCALVNDMSDNSYKNYLLTLLED